ncbi:ABC transporter ATP-binding protein [Clostridioides difficile]|uniref:ABC transporter ATP-binding protein n=1 Tax=Clostridioides difficile TaxID=1496 RepID=UPI000E5489FA|nr:ATP-binding cassette domain-containing protein [Clostridioides difficile]AXU77180.1 ABC transporter ATP-binding protein [Clostridioides difficile]MDL0416097.1 ATP-binding cassette domain-containing protein [Clostridioides difficile]
MSIIELNELTKSYRRFEKKAGFMGSVKSLFNRKYTEKTAISSFDLKIEEGEFVGLIGQNGAGKTTLIKMLTGIIAPSSGEISVMGYYPNKLENNFKKQYAVVMGQKSQLFFELTPADTFLLFKELYDISNEEYKKNLDYFIELFEVSDYLNVQVRTLSLGERMKMELIVALLHNPKILFLDEPTIGLDAIAQKQIRYFLKEVNETKGTTIILTSHYMEDIKSLCSRSIVVENSHKIYDGSTERLFNHFQKYKKITVSFSNETNIVFPKDCKVVEQTNHKISVIVPKERGNETIKWIFDKYDVKDVMIEEEDIGSIVERIYKKGSDEYYEQL